MNFQQHTPLSVLGFAVAFRAVHKVLSSFPLPQHVIQDKTKTWKWRNLSVSLLHSFLTGPWAVLCILSAPEMLTKIEKEYTSVSYLLICVSSGYFLQDTADIILSGQAKSSWEFLLHHSLVLSTFLYAVFSHRYIAGATIALFVEVNSVFLHSRLLLKLADARASYIYHINKYLNLITYVCFRLAAQFYLTWYIIENFAVLKHAAFFLTAMMLMNIMILIYFLRLLRADFSKKHKVHLSQTGNHYSKKYTDD
ncbi:TLC domain-containing protein 1 [Protopterus annectens]|uniref:TLC domain-containing protein 1 n=1 Tax=Protopterus annectens TaxID=7888 RepID=UPI001CF9FEDB|nr:TLC domain-containing protein 1 [Protopterus annectens]